MEGVNQYKDITLVWEADAAATFTISTDLPGGAMAARRTITLPASGAQRIERTFPLDTTLHGGDGKLLEGRLIQYKAAPAGKLILYSGFVRVRRVGTYVDGTAGEIWETQPISLGA